MKDTTMPRRKKVVVVPLFLILGIFAVRQYSPLHGNVCMCLFSGRDEGKKKEAPPCPRGTSLLFLILGVLPCDNIHLFIVAGACLMKRGDEEKKELLPLPT